MTRFIVTEQERKDILNLYKKNVIKESSSCICPDGSTHPSCCGGSQKINLAGMSEEEKQKALAMANSIISQNKAIIQSNIDNKTKTEIEKLTSEIGKLITSLNTASNRQTRKEIRNQLDIYRQKIENLENGSGGSSNNGSNQTADQKVSAWIRVASNLVSLLMGFLVLKNKIGNSNSPSGGGSLLNGGGGDDGGVG